MAIHQIPCNHCNGTGDCTKGEMLLEKQTSCADCRQKASLALKVGLGLFDIAPCSRCGGKGFHVVFEPKPKQQQQTKNNNQKNNGGKND